MTKKNKIIETINPIIQKDGMMLIEKEGSIGIWVRMNMLNFEKQLFCYRCTSHVYPEMKHAISTFYYDIENQAIESTLPHCPICGQELYDHNLANHAFSLKSYLHAKYFKRNQVRLHEVY